MPRHKKKENSAAKWGGLKIVTCNFPERDLAIIEDFIEIYKLTPSRSEYVRNAVRNQINKDLKFARRSRGFLDKKLIIDPNKFVLIPGYNGNKPVRLLRRLE